MDSFPAWLRRVRRASRLSQAALASAVRKEEPASAVYQGRITDWELGKSLPTLRQLALITKVLGLTAEEFAHGEALWKESELSGLSLPDLHETPQGAGNQPLPSSAYDFENADTVIGACASEPSAA